MPAAPMAIAIQLREVTFSPRIGPLKPATTSGATKKRATVWAIWRWAMAR